VKAMVLATINAKTIRNVTFLAQTMLLIALNDMQVSLLVGFWQVRARYLASAKSRVSSKMPCGAQTKLVAHVPIKEARPLEPEIPMLLRTSIAALLLLYAGPCSAGSAALSAYVGNSPSDLRQFEDWLGRPVDQITAHTGRADWKDWITSIRWSIQLWSPLDKPICWTIPLFADGGSLTEAAAGKYQDRYEQAARMLAQTRQSDPIIYVRTGEEFNGNWMPWSATGHEQDFVQAFRKFVDAFRSVSNRFRFEWNVNVRETRTQSMPIQVMIMSTSSGWTSTTTPSGTRPTQSRHGMKW